MVRSHTIMVKSHPEPKKSLVVGARPNLVYSPGPGLWTLDLGSFGPDLDLTWTWPGPDLDLTWIRDLDLSLRILMFNCLISTLYKFFQDRCENCKMTSDSISRSCNYRAEQSTLQSPSLSNTRAGPRLKKGKYHYSSRAPLKDMRAKKLVIFPV